MYAVIKASSDPTLQAAINDPAVINGIIMAVLGVLAKDFNVSGTPPNEVAASMATMAQGSPPNAKPLSITPTPPPAA
jgi:hypothetical protein